MNVCVCPFMKFHEQELRDSLSLPQSHGHIECIRCSYFHVLCVMTCIGSIQLYDD